MDSCNFSPNSPNPSDSTFTLSFNLHTPSPPSYSFLQQDTPSGSPLPLNGRVNRPTSQEKIEKLDELNYSERCLTLLDSPRMTIRVYHTKFDWNDPIAFKNLVLHFFKNSQNIPPLIALGYGAYNGPIPYQTSASETLALDGSDTGKICRMANQLLSNYIELMKVSEEEKREIQEFYSSVSSYTAFFFMRVLMGRGMVMRLPLESERPILLANQTQGLIDPEHGHEHFVVLNPLSSPNMMVGCAQARIYQSGSVPICWIRNLQINPSVCRQGFGSLLLSYLLHMAFLSQCQEIIVNPSSDSLPFFAIRGFKPSDIPDEQWYTLSLGHKVHLLHLFVQNPANFIVLSLLNPETDESLKKLTEACLNPYYKLKSPTDKHLFFDPSPLPSWAHFFETLWMAPLPKTLADGQSVSRGVVKIRSFKDVTQQFQKESRN